MSNASLYAADGVWMATPNNSSSSVNWASVLSQLNGAQHLVVEDFYANLLRYPGSSTYDFAISISYAPDYVMSFNEADLIANHNDFQNYRWIVDTGGSTSDCSLLYPLTPQGASVTYRLGSPYYGQQYPDEIGGTRTALGTGSPQVLVNVRWWNIAQLRSYGENALASPDCGGLSFEFWPEPSQAATQDIPAGILYSLQQNKECYLLLAPTCVWAKDNGIGGFNDYLGQIQRFARFLRDSYPTTLASPKVHFVLAAYVRNTNQSDPFTTNVGFLQGDNGSDLNNSIYAAANWLKAFRRGQVQ